METPSAESEQLPTETLPIETLPIEALKAPHREILIRAVANVLSSPIAKQTYAQIVDGLPSSDIAMDHYLRPFCSQHPLLEEHKEPCPGVPEEAEKLCSGLNAGTLLLPSTVRN
jgi:hypothetical protein